MKRNEKTRKIKTNIISSTKQYVFDPILFNIKTKNETDSFNDRKLSLNTEHNVLIIYIYRRGIRRGDVIFFCFFSSTAVLVLQWQYWLYMFNYKNWIKSQTEMAVERKTIIAAPFFLEKNGGIRTQKKNLKIISDYNCNWNDDDMPILWFAWIHFPCTGSPPELISNSYIWILYREEKKKYNIYLYRIADSREREREKDANILPTQFRIWYFPWKNSCSTSKKRKKEKVIRVE